MTSLIGLLGLGGRAYQAYSAGVATVGNNVSNVATEGYSRQHVDLSADVVLGGVQAQGSYRTEDLLLAAQERDNAAAFGFASESTSALLGLDGGLTGVPEPLPESISSFFDGLNALQGTPQDGARLQDVLVRAQRLADGFSSAATAVTSSAQSAGLRARGYADEVNELTAQIAAANETLAVRDNPGLADQRDLAAERLSALVGGNARIDPDGHMRFVANGGAVLVDGNRTNMMSVSQDPSDPMAVVVTVGDGAAARDVTGELGAGQLGAAVEFITGTAADTMSQLDQLAFDLANAVNTVHASNQAADGTTGLNLFDVPAGPAGAASSIGVNATIAADPSLLATSTLGAAAGDNGGVNAMLAVRDSMSAAGGQRTATEEAIQILSGVGRLASESQSAGELHAARGEMLVAQRDSLSGVSLQEEMVRLSEFQRAAEAASTYVSTVDQMLANLLATL